MALEKATLTNTVTGERVPVLFNPEEYTLSRRSTTRRRRFPGCRRRCSSSCTARMQTLEMELLVDTLRGAPAAGTRAGDGRARRRRARSSDLMNIDADDARAARRAVRLGLADVHLRARARDAALHHVPPDGVPVRARLQVTFNEFRNVELEAKEIKRETADYSKRYTVVPGRDARGDRRGAPTANPRSGGRSRSATRSTIRASCRLGTRARDPAAALPRSRQRRGVRVTNPRFAPEFVAAPRRRGRPGRAARRRSRASRLESSLGAADRVELTLANEQPALARPSAAQARHRARRSASATRRTRSSSSSSARSSATPPTFPSGGMPDADRRRRRTAACRLQDGTKERWFAVPIPKYGNTPDPRHRRRVARGAARTCSCRTSTRSAPRCR